MKEYLIPGLVTLVVAVLAFYIVQFIESQRASGTTKISGESMVTA